MMILLVSVAIWEAVAAGYSSINTCYDDPASLQLPNYKKNKMTLDILTTMNGAPVEERDTEVLNSNLASQVYFMELVSKVVRERIPDRVVHVKGAGAFGYFEVTNDTIAKYCMSDFLSKVGKKTPIVMRFSPSKAEKGEADIQTDAIGMGIKFKTQEGNFDLTLVNTKCYAYREPGLFLSVLRALKRNPVTNCKDLHMFWDLVTLKPELFPMFFFIFGDAGSPDGYRHVPGYSVHTYQVYNTNGESYFWRWVLEPECGRKNLCLEEASKVACLDPDYAIRDLHNSIEKCNYPKYKLGVQHLTAEQVKKCPFDVFDITKFLPEEDYPVMPVGVIVLNKNPTNYFSDVEQVAFNPSNLITGILGAPDNAFISRGFAYRDAQSYRLGVNYDNIPVNRPLPTVYTYNRDGRPPVPSAEINGPNYYPNFYNGPVPYRNKKKPSLIKIKYRQGKNDLSQINEIYKKMSDAERSRMAVKISDSIGRVSKPLQDRALNLLAIVGTDLECRVRILLAASVQPCCQF